MSTETARLSSQAAGAATAPSDAFLLLGRILLASVFILTAANGSPTAAYLTNLHYPSPAMMSMLAVAIECVIGISLVLGVWTRYGALLAVAYVIIAVATAHRYWEFPEAQQTVQYIFATKDLSILGGLVVLFGSGPGRYSIDAKRGGK